MKRGFMKTLKAKIERAFRHEILPLMTLVVVEVLLMCWVSGLQENLFLH